LNQYYCIGEADPNPDTMSLCGVKNAPFRFLETRSVMYVYTHTHTHTTSDILSLDCSVALGFMPVVTLVCARQLFDELSRTDGAGLFITTRHIQRLHYIGSPVVGFVNSTVACRSIWNRQ
jgi:hypothetical protein